MSFTSPQDLFHLAYKLGAQLIGVYAKDQIIQPLRNGGYIINMQSARDGNGTHWVAFWIEGRRAAYFDSFGVEYPPLEIDMALRPYLTVKNKQQIQNIESGYCGPYCLSFIYVMAKYKKKIPRLSERLKYFDSLWSKDPEDNLRILKRTFLGHRK